MVDAAHSLASVTPPAPHSPPRRPPVLVLATTALVATGALLGSALFFTAGLVLVPVIVAGAIFAMVVSRRSRARARQRAEDERAAGER